jgi:hypothetical protein
MVIKRIYSQEASTMLNSFSSKIFCFPEYADFSEKALFKRTLVLAQKSLCMAHFFSSSLIEKIK